MPLTTEQKKKYAIDWKYLSAKTIYITAQNKCQACGAKNKEKHPTKKYTVILACAHINHIETDNREENLKALCQTCHLNHDRENNIYRRIRRRK